MGYRVLIVGDKRVSEELAAILKGEGYEDVHLAHGGVTTLDMADRLAPEVVLMDIVMAGEDTVRLAKEILLRRPVPIVLHASYSQAEKVKQADDVGVSAHLFRPVTRENLINAIELGVSRFRQCQALHAELGDCKEALRVRKLVERAKGILMKRNSLSEEEAYLKLQNLSRNNNISMDKVAESIITADKVI